MAKRALVLGGGGPVGIGWESGLLAGLAEEGIDLSNGDLICGTSAGSFVGAQLALGRAPGAIVAPYLNEKEPAESVNPPDLTVLVVKMMDAVTGARPVKEVRAEIGAWALSTPTISEDEFIERFAPSLNGEADGQWPKRPFVCTAVDTADGSFLVWDKSSGVGLARAVASSCAVPGVYPPITINGRRYMDGGMRSSTSADVAKDCDRVVVIAVMSGRGAPTLAEAFRRKLDTELQALKDIGRQVELIVPDANSADAFGPNLMDARRRSGAAKAGFQQGRSIAAHIGAFWSEV
ncbi:MAG TPA: patatin-like phospholipase family protein [Bryobacteraceae bacterium]|nr:patatin-like phospholipase family protein [Bryobacteraceae bacterium]